MEPKKLKVDIGAKERNSDTKQTNETFKHICELFSPLRDEWLFIQEILLWKKIEISVILFNILNVLFWIFLTPRLKLFVSVAIVLSLLWLTPPIRHWILFHVQSLSAKRAEIVDSDDAAEVRDLEEDQIKRRKITYEDFCHGVATIWTFVTKYWLKLMNLKEENRQKFYVVLSLLVVIVAVVIAQCPIGNIMYFTVMFLYLWPAIVFYGIKDKVVWKLQKLFRPFFTQWQSSRTKRKRNTFLTGSHSVSDISDDDEFTLNATASETVVNPAISPQVRAQQEEPAGHLDSVNSSLTFIDGLEFPSMRRDSAESFNSDDFVQGLNFSGITPGSHHSSMDSLNDENLHSQNDETIRPDNDHLQTSVDYFSRQSQPEYNTEIKSRVDDPLFSVRPPSRNKSSDDEDYEVINTSEVQVDMNRENEQQEQDDSYIASGTAYMGKFFGYS